MVERSFDGAVWQQVIETLRAAEEPLGVTELRTQVAYKLGFNEEKVRAVVFRMIQSGQLQLTADKKVVR
jgi:DNA-binding transcriptional regulator PaaX